MIRNSEILRNIDPRLALVALVASLRVDFDVIAGSGYRSSEEQDKLYSYGRDTPGPIATNARGGQSAHNFAAALDIDPIPATTANYKVWGEMCEEVGKTMHIPVKWGGRFNVGGQPDVRHIELEAWKTMQQPRLEWKHYYSMFAAVTTLAALATLVSRK